VITSLKNPKVAAAIKLKKRAFRDRERRFLVEGAQAIGEALSSAGGISQLVRSSDLHPVVTRAREAGVEVVEVSEAVMAKLTSTVTPQGLVAVAPYLDVPPDAVPERPGCVAVLHAVRDPGNAGTVLRSADAAGADAVIFSDSSVDPYNPKTVRASAGSLFHLPVVRGAPTPAAVAALRGRGCRVLAMDARGQADLYGMDLSGPVAFLFGNEAWGLPGEVAALADGMVRVPIARRAESLNLAAAASVCLFEWARQRRQGRRSALETVIASAAHDIRSPLTAMKGFGFALSSRWEQMSAEHRSLMLQGIVHDTDRMNIIVRQLVDAARIVAGNLELFPQLVELEELVARVAEERRGDPGHPAVRWTGGRVRAFVDPDRLQLILEAFMEAEVWWASEGPVVVSGGVDEGRLVLEVFRAGTELDPEGAGALFEPRPPGTGSGSKIGLFVARGVAEAQGGSATVHVEDGLRFRLEVPAVPEP
jgi:TrmH family RNA methyltransferase